MAPTPAPNASPRPSAIRAEHPAVWSGLQCPACHCSVSRERLDYANQVIATTRARAFANAFIAAGALSAIFAAVAWMFLRAGAA